MGVFVVLPNDPVPDFLQLICKLFEPDDLESQVMQSFAAFPQEFCHETVFLERLEQLDLRTAGIAILFEAECTFLYFFTEEKDASQYIPIEPGGLADAVNCMSGVIQF